MNVTIAGIGDELGPSKILLLREPGAGLEAFIVVDNIACGLERAKKLNCAPRQAALEMARSRVEEAMRYRRVY